MSGYDAMTSRKQFLLREIDAAKRALDAMRLIPSVDEYPDGTIIRVVVEVVGGAEVTYALLKMAGSGTPPRNTHDRWYYTGDLRARQLRDQSAPWATWSSLISALTQSGVVVKEWDVIWPQPTVKDVVVVGALPTHLQYIVSVPDDLPPGEYHIEWDENAMKWRLV